MKNKSITILIPVLLGFFVMGFVDVVGVSASYVKKDFGLNDKLSNLLPMMVFLWFAICSLPTGLLMGRIGRKKTVLISAVITFIAMLLPVINYSFTTVLIAFALLGIGNTVLQVSLNPLLTNVVSQSKITSMLTLGQFIKAVSSTLGPVIAGVAVGVWGNWQLIFPVYAGVTLLFGIWLWVTKVKEPAEEKIDKASKSSIFSLFRNPLLILCFSVILLIVGFEIGLMTATPKYLFERCDLPIEKGGFGNSLYYSARMIGTFIGSFLLAKVSSRKFLLLNMLAAVSCFAVFMLTGNLTILLVALFGLGLFCANVFPIVFSAAIQFEPSRANEISALMIMGVAGGALLPMVMGIVADMSNQFVSLFVLLFTLLYTLGVSFKLTTNKI